MGVGTESALLVQAKKAQGETNARLEAIHRELLETNQLLRALYQSLARQP